LADVGAGKNEDSRLTGCVIIFEVTRTMRPLYLKWRTTYDSNTALCTCVHRAVKRMVHG